MSIPFIDLAAQQKRLRSQIDAAIDAVLASGQYILGPEVGEFEGKLAEFAHSRHALGCANGTDALLLPLMAWGVGEGDAVFCPSFTYCATAEVVALAGAVPVFVDIDRRTYNMDAGSLRRAVRGVLDGGQLVPRAVITVDLFGQSADYDAIAPVAQEFGLRLIADSAQGFGSTLDGKHPNAWADCQTTSFFPAKPLGCYGDGGAVLTDDAELDGVMRSLHFHGRGGDRYDNVRIGLNSRLDTMQAAILLQKLSVFESEIEARDRIAARYTAGLEGYVTRTPVIKEGVRPTWAQYTVEVPDPEGFAEYMKAAGVPTARYYPRPIHLQTAYKDFPVGAGGLPNTEDCMGHVISLPMHPYLEKGVQDHIIQSAQEASARSR